jgi:SagB-type dehydrogenase family enzyme
MYKAEGLRHRFEQDPQMLCPERPRFSEDYLVVPLAGQGLLVAGGGQREIFRGKTATLLLPRLLPLLDGTRSLADLEARLRPARPEVVRDAVWLLYFRGLLEEGPSEADRADERAWAEAGLDRQLRFFGRYTDVNRASANRYGTQRRLERSRVLVAGPEALADPLSRALACRGVGGVAVASLSDATDLEAALSGLHLVIAVAGEEQPHPWSRLDRTCRSRGVPWIRAVIAADAVEIGPRFSPHETACYRCATRFLAAPPPRRAEDPTARAAGLAYLELATLMDLSALFSTELDDRARRLELTTGRLVDTCVLRLPRCRACGPGAHRGPELQLPDDLPALFHLQTNHKWDGLTPKSHQTHYSAHVTDLARGAYKTYLTRPRVALPRLEDLPPLRTDLADSLQGMAPPAPGPLTLAHVAQVCGWSARWRTEAFPYRFTPSGGGLCSSDLYVLAWQVEGLAPGLYHYQGKTHLLEALRAGDRRASLRAALPEGAPLDRAGLALVQTSHLARVYSKYGPRAYRYVHLDTGVMTRSLVMVAGALGLMAWSTGDFADDAVADLLAVPPRAEFPSRVVLLGGGVREGEGGTR